MASENSPADTVTRTAETGSGRLTSRLRAILAIVLIADVLDLMDSTITNIAAPSIVRDIGGGESLIKWLGASYALAMGVLLVLGGRLGDRYGKRRLFLIGIAGFAAASLLCGIAVAPPMLIAARLLQAASAPCSSRRGSASSRPRSRARSCLAPLPHSARSWASPRSWGRSSPASSSTPTSAACPGGRCS